MLCWFLPYNNETGMHFFYKNRHKICKHLSPCYVLKAMLEARTDQRPETTQFLFSELSGKRDVEQVNLKIKHSIV